MRNESKGLEPLLSLARVRDRQNEILKFSTYKIFREMAMRLATSPHHTNPRSATLDFWRQTTSVEEYKKVQERRRLQTNRPTSSNEQKEEHLIIGECRV